MLFLALFINTLLLASQVAAAPAPAVYGLYASCDSFVTINGAPATGQFILTNDFVKNTSRGVGFITFDTAGQAFGDPAVAHVHNKACDVSNGGAHWKFNPKSNDSTIMNEFHWDTLSLVADSNSTWFMESINPNVYLRDETFGSDTLASIVVHSSNNTRLVCCNLNKYPATSFLVQVAETAASPVDVEMKTINGSSTAYAYSAIFANLTHTVSFMGAEIGESSDQVGIAHVHKSPCNTGNGGGHWMFDFSKYPLNMSAPVWHEDNEIWFRYTKGNTMYNSGVVYDSIPSNFPNATYVNATSIVIHRADSTLRLYCTDLKLTVPLPLPDLATFFPGFRQHGPHDHGTEAPTDPTPSAAPAVSMLAFAAYVLLLLSFY